MSSFVGHSITSVGLYVLLQREGNSSLHVSWSWLLWLGLVALAPDVDYVVPFLNATSNGGMRITHSIGFSLVLPVISILLLRRSQAPSVDKWFKSLQVVGVGLSHIGMDMLVGVTALPLLWPVSSSLFQLPIGILPSAPTIQLDNYSLYRNTMMEVGILIPFYASIYLARYARLTRARSTVTLLALCGCWIGFAYWGYTLAR